MATIYGWLHCEGDRWGECSTDELSPAECLSVGGWQLAHRTSLHWSVKTIQFGGKAQRRKRRLQVSLTLGLCARPISPIATRSCLLVGRPNERLVCPPMIMMIELTIGKDDPWQINLSSALSQLATPTLPSPFILPTNQLPYTGRTGPGRCVRHATVQQRQMDHRWTTPVDGP